MKKKILISAVLIGAVAFSITAFKNEQTITYTPSPTSSSKNLLGNQFKLASLPVKTKPLFYSVWGRYKTAVSAIELKSARSIADFYPNYPSSWIDGYESVQLTVTINGETKTFKAPNDQLTPEQKVALASVDIATEIKVQINYIKQNAVIDSIEHRTINTSLTVLPTQEAVFEGGRDSVLAYLRARSEEQIRVQLSTGLMAARIHFTINTEGKAEQISLDSSCKDPKVDEFLLLLIAEMPAWNPATDSNGKAVPQQFAFVVSNDSC